MDILPGIVEGDRQAAVTDLGYSDFTIRGYLKGRGNNLKTAMEIIKYFKDRFKAREKELEKLSKTFSDKVL